MFKGAFCGFLALFIVLGLSGGIPHPAWAGGGDDGEDDWIRTSGDILQIALPVLGGGATFFTNPDPDKTWDREGTRQFAWAYGSAWTTTYFLKIVASKARPNGNNRTSFPSGHTMSAFAGAGFIDGRYGRNWGIPALALAAFTGYSRVHSQWHYADDVLAGASIGLIYNWHFVTPQRGNVQFLPTVGQNGYGVQVTIGGGGGEDEEPEDTSPRRASYQFGFGPAFLVENSVGTPGAGIFQLGDLDGNNDPTTTASVTVGFPTSSKGRVNISWGPFEARDEGSFQQDVEFDGMTVPAGTPVYSAWRFYDLRAQYEHQLLDSRAWGVMGGVGLGLSYSYAALEYQDASDSRLVEEDVPYPYLVGAVERRMGDKWKLQLYSDGVIIGNDYILDVNLTLAYRAGRAWDFAGGFKYFTRKIESDVMYNKVRYNIPFLGVIRYW